MKARRVKGLDPGGPVADNAQRIVRTRLAELLSFMPAAEDPEEVEALHDMRIAAKRLRYVLEITAPVLGPYAAKAVGIVKDLQDLLGEIHDCDEMIPRVAAHLDTLLLMDARVLRERAEQAGAEDLDPELVAGAPSLDAYSGLAALLVHLQARRELLFGRFSSTWRELQRSGFAARLEFAASERADVPAGTPAGESPDAPAAPAGDR